MAGENTIGRTMNLGFLHLQKLALELKCPLCLNFLKKPYILPCDHIFCGSCLPKSKQLGPECPYCKVPCADEDSRHLPFIENLVTIYKGLDAAFHATAVQSVGSDPQGLGSKDESLKASFNHSIQVRNCPFSPMSKTSDPVPSTPVGSVGKEKGMSDKCRLPRGLKDNNENVVEDGGRKAKPNAQSPLIDSQTGTQSLKEYGTRTHVDQLSLGSPSFGDLKDSEDDSNDQGGNDTPQNHAMSLVKQGFVDNQQLGVHDSSPFGTSEEHLTNSKRQKLNYGSKDTSLPNAGRFEASGSQAEKLVMSRVHNPAASNQLPATINVCGFSQSSSVSQVGDDVGIYNQRYYVDQGPSDPTVLYDQPNHRSMDIWNDHEEAHQIICYRGTTNVLPWNDVILPFLKKARLESIRHFSGIKIDRQLITALVERWRKETHCFNFSEGECTITLKDIAILTHLPIDGNVVCVNDHPPPDVGDMTGWQHLIHNVLEVRVPVKGSVDATDRLAPLRTNQVSITWLTKWIKNLHDPAKGGVPLTKESPEAVKERYARVYLIGMIGGVFFPKKANNLISCGWLKILLGNWDAMGELSWASACLANIYHHLCNASLKAVKEVGGAMFIVQFWAWEHLPLIAPINHLDKNWPIDHPLRGQAYGCRWVGVTTCDNLSEHKLAEYRRRLERLLEGEIIYDPYPENIVHWHCQQFSGHVGQWCTRVPLICHHIMEWHLPDRCLRQFGREQCIPLEVPESQKAFHHRDGRQGAEDWPLKLKKFITMWDNRQDFEIVTPTTVRRMGYHDPYMDIYRQQSVRYVTPEGAADGALVDGLELIKDMTHGRDELVNEEVDFLRRITNSLLGCVRARGRDHHRYPYMLEQVLPQVAVDIDNPPPSYRRRQNKKAKH